MSTCYFCNSEIYFSPLVVSAKSQKQIPLDPGEVPHKCKALKMTSRLVKCYKCDEEIAFSDDRVSKFGTKIPLDPVSMEPHECPNHYN